MKLCKVSLVNCELLVLMKMNINIEIARLVDCDAVSDEFIREVVELTVLRSGLRFAQNVNFSLSVAIVSDEEIAQLNSQYRGNNKPTDVLSFPDEFVEAVPDRREQLVQFEVDGDIALGELVLGCQYIKKCATMDTVPLEQEFAFVIAHGILHLLGYDHGDDMFAIGQEVTDLIHEKQQ